MREYGQLETVVYKGNARNSYEKIRQVLRPEYIHKGTKWVIWWLTSGVYGANTTPVCWKSVKAQTRTIMRPKSQLLIIQKEFDYGETQIAIVYLNNNKAAGTGGLAAAPFSSLCHFVERSWFCFFKFIPAYIFCVNECINLRIELTKSSSSSSVLPNLLGNYLILSSDKFAIPLPDINKPPLQIHIINTSKSE